jgi:hypothetical protein
MKPVGSSEFSLVLASEWRSSYYSEIISSRDYSFFFNTFFLSFLSLFFFFLSTTALLFLTTLDFSFVLLLVLAASEAVPFLCVAFYDALVKTFVEFTVLAAGFDSF